MIEKVIYIHIEDVPLKTQRDIPGVQGARCYVIMVNGLPALVSYSTKPLANRHARAIGRDRLALYKKTFPKVKAYFQGRELKELKR